MGVFSQLRQRRLFQIVVAYLAGGWIALEGLSQLTQHQILPELVYKLGLMWYVAGIAAALLIGWHHGEKGKQKAPLSEVVILLGVLLLAGSLSGVRVVDEVTKRSALAAARESALELDRVAVLYFEDLSPDAEMQHIADGLTESLIDEFAAVRNLEVVSRNGVAAFRGATLPPDSVAAALGAGTLVQGDIRRVGDRLRVNVALLEGETGAPFGRRASFERPLDDFFAVREGLAEEVSRLLREWLGGEVQLRRTRNETSSQAAWVLYQRAEKARKDGEAAIANHDVDGGFAAFARADSILGQVEILDPTWSAPGILRGEIDYRRARATRDRHGRVGYAEAGLEDVERALRIEPNDARATGLRGTLRYFKYLQNVIADHDAAEALRVAALKDLERAVDLDPTLGGVWSALQHMYYTRSLPDAVRAGERAYEEDAYLEAAADIVFRLYSGHFDLGNFTNALGWCDEGARRFPLDSRFAECYIELLNTTALPADPDRAWALAARVDSLAQPHRREYAGVQARIFVAGALGRANLPDSARAVLSRAHDRIDHEIDPHFYLLSFEAAIWSVLGQDDHAIDLLKRHKAATPDASFEHHWWWRTIRSHPRYHEIGGGGHHH